MGGMNNVVTRVVDVTGRTRPLTAHVSMFPSNKTIIRVYSTRPIGISHVVQSKHHNGTIGVLARLKETQTDKACPSRIRSALVMG